MVCPDYGEWPGKGTRAEVGRLVETLHRISTDGMIVWIGVVTEEME